MRGAARGPAGSQLGLGLTAIFLTVSVHFATPLRIGCDIVALSFEPTSGAVSPAGMAAFASASAMLIVSVVVR
jgi:hypothetical protein